MEATEAKGENSCEEIADNFERRQFNILIVFLLLVIFFFEFLPSESFLTAFLVSKGLHNSQVSDEVFPLWFYARFPALVVMGLLAEVLGNLGTLALGLVFGATTVSMTAFGASLTVMQLTQFTVALSTAAHTGALYGLLFELSAKRMNGYQAPVHWSHAVLLVSNGTANLLGSYLRTALKVPLSTLWWVSLGSQCVALAIMVALAIGCCQQGVGFPRQTGAWFLCRDLYKNFWLVGVREWTFAVICTAVAHSFVGTYWQSLLRVQKHDNEDLNGYISALAFFVTAVFLTATSQTRCFRNRTYRRPFITILLSVAGILVHLIGVSSGSAGLYTAYVAYQLVFRAFGVLAMQQVGGEVCAVVDMDRTQRRTRLALLFSVTSICSSCVEAFVQLLFLHVPGSSKSGHLLLKTRFESMGLFLCSMAVLYLIGTKLGCFGVNSAAVEESREASWQR